MFDHIVVIPFYDEIFASNVRKFTTIMAEPITWVGICALLVLVICSFRGTLTIARITFCSLAPFIYALLAAFLRLHLQTAQWSYGGINGPQDPYYFIAYALFPVYWGLILSAALFFVGILYLLPAGIMAFFDHVRTRHKNKKT